MPPEDDETLDLVTGLPVVPAIAPPVPAVPAVPAVVPAVPPAPAPAVAAPPALTPAQRRAADEATASDIRKREQRKLWREEYGTDDEAKVNEIKAQRTKALEEHQQLTADAEKRKREQMSEVERLTADIQTKDAKIIKLESELESLKKDRLAAQQDTKIRSIAVQHIKPTMLKYAIVDFGEYVRSLTKADAAKLDELRTTNWFKKFARENPVMAAEAKAPPAADTTTTTEPEVMAAPKPGLPPAVQRPGARAPVPAGARRPAAPAPAKPAVPDPLAGKTPRPGLPNSMNRQELAEHMKRQGLRPL